MTRSHRTWRFGIACSLALLTLVGCASAPKPTPTISDKPVVLTMLTLPGLSREPIDEAIRLYTKQHPNVTIKVKESSPGGAILSGQFDTATLEGIDIALLPRTTAQNLHAEGVLKDLSSVRIPQLNEAIAGVYDDLSKEEGKRFNLPFDITPSLLMINEEVMKSAGVKVPSVDWTIQEFEQTLLALKDAGKLPVLYLNLFFESVVRAYGGQVYDADTDAWAFDTPEAKQGIEALARLVSDELLQNSGAGGFRVMIGGGPNAPALTALPPGMSLPMPTQKQPYPRGPHGRPVPVSATVATVMASSGNPDVAVDFLKEMISNEAVQTAFGEAGIRPVLASTKALAAWEQRVGDKTVQAIELSLQDGFVQPNLSYSDLLVNLKPFFNGQATLEQLMDSLLASQVQ